MTTDPHNTASDASRNPHHADVSSEKRDVNVSSIYWYMLILAIATFASFAVCIFILKYMNSFVSESETLPPPSRLAMGKNYHPLREGPLLQGVPGNEADAQQDMRDMRKSDAEANEETRWVDQSAGIAQIPVKDAMKIIAEKGLPGGPAVAAEKKK
jgi:hypothetical protein